MSVESAAGGGTVFRLLPLFPPKTYQNPEGVDEGAGCGPLPVNRNLYKLSRAV